MAILTQMDALNDFYKTLLNNILFKRKSQKLNHFQRMRLAVVFACWNFSLFLSLKTTEKSNRQTQQLNAYVANGYTLSIMQCKTYTNCNNVVLKKLKKEKSR